MRTLFNKFGKPIAHFDINFDIYSIDGIPLAYLEDAKVYTYSGKHIGWYIDGWIRDNKGYCVFFDESSTGGPVKPAQQAIPTLGVLHTKPTKETKQVPFVRPVKRCAWSYSSNLDYFK